MIFIIFLIAYSNFTLFSNVINKEKIINKNKRKNMVGRTLSAVDSILLRKRALIRTVNDELKNICQIGHSRQRSFSIFFSNFLSASTSYTFFVKKPSLDLYVLNEKNFSLYCFKHFLNRTHVKIIISTKKTRFVSHLFLANKKTPLLCGV